MDERYLKEYELMDRAMAAANGLLIKSSDPKRLRNRFYAALKIHRRTLAKTGAPEGADQYAQITFAFVEGGLRIYKLDDLFGEIIED